MIRVSFEVFGKVQGVYFRKYTKEEAKKLSLHGWCRNTDKNTVEGQLEGTAKNVDNMVHWLSNKGSPASKILKCVVGKRETITQKEFSEFKIIK